MDSDDHLEEAAARAVGLAADLCEPRDPGDGVAVDAAQHLTYLAGLIRGGAAGRTISAREIARGRLRAEVTSSIRPTFEDADPGDHDPSEDVAARGILAVERDARLRAEQENVELRDVGKVEREARVRAERERDELLAAAQAVPESGPGRGIALARLRSVARRIAGHDPDDAPYIVERRQG